jgi:photosystem II stability/assembly factor-like uncharacterized protein
MRLDKIRRLYEKTTSSKFALSGEIGNAVNSVAMSAQGNLFETINEGKQNLENPHDRNRLSSDGYRFWLADVGGLLSTGEHPVAEAWFVKRGVKY